MASMKLCKPSFSYGASQSNFSKYEHQEEHNMNQSSLVDHGWASKPNYGSGYYGQAQQTNMGRATYGYNEDVSGHSWANGSTHHYAQAQQALPMPSIRVQQGQQVMEKESHMSQEWVSNGAKCSSPARPSSGVGMIVKMKHGWANKSDQCSSPTARASEYGASMYKGQEANSYQYSKGGGASGGWAGRTTSFSGPNQVNHSAQMMYAHEKHGGANGPTKVQASHSSAMMHKEEHMMGKMDDGTTMHNQGQIMAKMGHDWAGSPKANHSSMAIHKEEHIMGKMDHGWAASPTKANHSSFAMHKEDHMMENMDHSHGWAASPTKANHSSLSMRREEHMMGKMDHGYAGSNHNNHSGHSSHSMHKEEHMMGPMDHGYAGSNHTNQSSHSSHSMRKEEHMMGPMDHGYAGSNHTNHLSHAMYKGQEHHGWAGKNGSSYGAAHMNQSAHAAYDHHDYGDVEDIEDIMDEILTKYPAHNVSGGHGGACVGQNQASSHAKQEAWAGSARHGGSAQSMAWKEKKEAYSSSSSSSSAMNKYGMSTGMSSGGGICMGNIGVGGCDD